jgi:RNA polymerase sigma-54 factor
VEMVDDELVISLNEYKIPGLRISNHYKKMIRQPKKLDKNVRKFLKEKIDSAKWFIKAIKQRQMTMQRTMEAIVKKQYDFFAKGPEHIKPMIMKDIADEIGMDISTVSRVCKGKYVETDWGIFELKYFFNEGMENEDGEDVSTLKIKERLKQIIENENPKKPLSDDKIADILNKEGIPIARRTVAKYREQLGIPVARLRRSI